MRLALFLCVIFMATTAHAQMIDFSVACQFIEDPQARQVCQQGNRSIQQQQREQQQRDRAAQQEALRHQRQLEMERSRAEIERQRQIQTEQRLERQRTATIRHLENSVPTPAPITPAYNAPVTTNPVIAPVQETPVPQPYLEPEQPEQTKTPRFWKAFGPYVLIAIFTLALFIYLLQENIPLRNIVLKNKANPLPDLAIHYLMTFLPLAGLYYSAVYIKDTYPAWFYSFVGMVILAVAYAVFSKKASPKIPENSQNNNAPPGIYPHTYYGGGVQSKEFIFSTVLPKIAASTVIQMPEPPAEDNAGLKNASLLSEIYFDLPEPQKMRLKNAGVIDTDAWGRIGNPKGNLKLEESRKHKIKIHNDACTHLFELMGGEKNNGNDFEYFCAALLAEEGWDMRITEKTGKYKNNDGGIDGFGWRKNESGYEWAFLQAKCTNKHTRKKDCHEFCNIISTIQDSNNIGNSAQTSWLKKYIVENTDKTGFFITTGDMNDLQKGIITRNNITNNIAMDGLSLLKKESLYPNQLGIAMTDYQWIYINEHIVLNAVQRMKEKSKTPLPILG